LSVVSPLPLPLLGLDPGGRRVGVALLDASGTWVHALTTLDRKSDWWSALQRLVKEHGAKGFALGWPLRKDGSEADQAQAARRFAAELAKRFPAMWIVLVDERLTSFGAEAELADAGLKKGSGPGADAHAARLILENFKAGATSDVVHRGS